MNAKSFLASTVERLTDTKIVPRWRLQRYAQTEYLARLIAAFEIDCIFDVGANVGQYHDYLRQQVGFKGHILSFEPHPDCIEKIEARLSDDSLWKLFPFALGEDSGIVSFNLTLDTQFSSFLGPNNTRVEAFMDMNKVENVVDVPVKMLDDVMIELVRSYEFKRPFLKLDTQGYDLNVLRGAKRTIYTFLGVQSELSNVPIYDGIPTMEESLYAFRSAGFSLGCIFPSEPGQFPVCVDFDTYFVRTDVLP